MNIKKKTHTPLKQLNGYGCGVYAVMNVSRYDGSRIYKHSDFKIQAITLHTDTFFGTAERDIVVHLRVLGGYKVTISTKLNLKKATKHLQNGGQIIVLYVSNPEENEEHYCNIFKITKKYCYGANFYKKDNTYQHKVTTYWLKQQEIVKVFYIRRQK